MSSLEEDPRAYESAVARLTARGFEAALPGVERATTLLELLGRPDQAYPAISVMGSHGKSSTTRMVASLLSALGLKAGSYTAPHLQDVRERIRIADEAISREVLLERLDELELFLEEVDERYPEPVTFSETVSTIAFAHFADAPVDVGVLEGGSEGQAPMSLGRADVTVLTPILGRGRDEDLDAVTRALTEPVPEAGLVVTAAQPPAVDSVVREVCRARGARLLTAGVDMIVSERRLAVGGQHVDLEAVTGAFDDLYIPLHGRHQADNALLALAAVEGLLGFQGGLDAEIIREGLAAVQVPGRLEVVRRTDASTVVLDGATDVHAAEALAAALREEFAFRHRVLVVGPLREDRLESVLTPLADLADHVVAVAEGVAASSHAARLSESLGESRASVEVADDVPSALELASGLAAEEDGVVLFGPLETIGAARAALGLGSG